ncbi:hypothetical protein DW352_08020 [Pseudolabrys taiwanensis]|uniref:Uncharacterized protein n=1 Tax=Pseudolabrys taiwanensis TaxID=331696 RepID=A0A345ZU67_9HYPH|nr:hypothetical protein [Pseudolabrys taiwanensis]AXK80464.1 hypothetical protein DW352_08020 [Pseudolabrys taiwanensis]
MRPIIAGVVIGLLALAPMAQAASDAAPGKPSVQKTKTHKPAHKSAHKKTRKKRVSRHWHGYGFLPGYRPPEVIEREREERYWASGPHWYGPAWPGFYRGRWNGGGFGPCYTYTPIGYMWNCGK